MKQEQRLRIMGQERLRSDRRQLGGMLLAMGVCVTFQPLLGMESLIGFTSDMGGEAFNRRWLISCGILQIIFGILAMVVGYLAVVHDYGNRRLTGTLILLTQLSWIPFATGIVQIGATISPPYITDTRTSWSDELVFLEEYVVNPFIPEDYLPNKNDVIFLGSMGLLGLITYGVGFFGSLAFLEFALYSFDAKKPTRRDSMYYRGRLLFYSFVILIAGMSQILFGAYILFEFGGGRLSPPIGIAMYRVSFPAITVAIGALQMVVGYHGVGNYLRLFPVGPNSNNFQILALVSWVLQLILQYIVQIGFVEGNENSTALTSLALYSFGISILPPFLDYKMRTTPISMSEENYNSASRDVELLIDISSDAASPEFRPLTGGRDVLMERLKTLEIQKESDDISGIEKSSSEGADNDDPETGPSAYEETNTGLSSQPSKNAIFSRLVSSLRGGRSIRGDKDEQKSIPDNSDNKVEEKPQAFEEQNKVYGPLIESPRKPRVETTQTIEYSTEPGVTVEETVEYPMDFGITVEETVEYPENSGARSSQLLEPGITVEEFIEYPDGYSPEKMFKKRTRKKGGYDSDNDDEDTPPRSNESFSTDMADTWGEHSRQELLSPIAETSSRRIVFGEQKQNRSFEGQESSVTRDTINPPLNYDDEGALQERASPQSKSFDDSLSPITNPTMTDSYYDYDSDEGYEISEATPDDDTAALDAKIDKLKENLISDTKNMEAYLTKIL